MSKLLRILLAFVGAAIFAGLFAAVTAVGFIAEALSGQRPFIIIGVGVVGLLISYILAPHWIKWFRVTFDSVAEYMDKIPIKDVLFGTIGLVIGLIIAGLVSRPMLQLSIAYVGNFIGVVISVLLYLVFGVLGIRIAVRGKDELMNGICKIKDDLISKREGQAERKKSKASKNLKKNVEWIDSNPKILDTSVIIDGRIFEVIRVGFLEGPFVISNYVLEELQHISDSADTLRRERGRKGLDLINELKKEREYDVVIDSRIIDDATEVDAKLLILTQELNGEIVTNDYNLNKVATVQGISVLNVNDLANALKPIVIPGEYMDVQIIKEGKESSQGLGYLDDGTMIVVENGKDFIGKNVHTIVTSVLQTSAGKMIFTRIE